MRDITLPNGFVVNGVPDDVTKEQLRQAAIDKGWAKPEDFPQEDYGFFDGVGDLAKGAGYGFASMVPLAAEGIGALSYATGLPILPGMDPEESLDESAIVQWGRQSQKDLREFFGGDSRSMAYGVGNALGSFASFFIPGLGQAGLAARGLGLAGKIVGTGGQATLAVGAGAGDQAERILNLYEQEGNKYPAAEEKLKQAILQGGAIGLSELAPVKMVGKILSRGIPKSVPAETRNKILGDAANLLFKTAPRRMASVGVGEGTQEAFAGYLQDLTEKGLYNPNLEVGESAMADFGYGGTAGAIFQGGIELITPGLRKRRQDRLDKEQAEELQAAAEEEEKIREVSPAGQIEDAPLALPTPQPVLMLEDMREDSDTFINATEDVSPLVEQTISEFADDLPLSFNRGAIVAADEVGTPDAYSVNTNNKGSFVESKQGVKVSPYFATTEQASEFRDGLNLGVNDLLETQDRAETNRLAAEAIKDAGYGPDSANVSTGSLLEAARRTQVTESIPVSDLPGDTVTQINARRLQTGQRAFSPDDLLTPGDLAEAGVSDDVISQVSPSSSLQVTPDDILSLAEQKNIMVEDAGFERFAQRLIGNARIDSPSVSPGQLGYLYESIEQMPALPGDGPQRLPVIKKPEFSGSQYSAVVSLAKRNGSEGILKSDINKTLDLKRGAPTESIINSAVERGDLIEHPTKKNRWMSRSVYDAEARSLDSPLRRGEQIEGEARRQEEAERQTQEARARAVLGPGIQIPRERQEGDTRSIPEASRDFKERISGSILTPEAESKMDDINRSIQQELQRFQKILPKGMAIGRDIQVKLVDSLGGDREGAAADPVDGKVVISLALDLANLNAKTTDQVKNNLKNVLNHEVIHALRSLGVLTDGDFAILEKYAKNNKRKGDTLTFYEDIKKRYTKYYEEELGTSPTEELLVEESIADAFRYWADGNVKLTGKPRSLFNRIVDFFKSLSNGFTNADITSAEQMFEGLRSPVGTTQRDRDVGLQAPDAPPDAAGVQAPDAPMDAPVAREPVIQPQAPQQAPRQAPQPDVVSEPDPADPVVVAEREEPVARPEPETVLDAEDEVALNKVLQGHDDFGQYKSLKGQAFNEQQVDAAKKLYIDLVDSGASTIMPQVIDTARLGRKYGVLVGDGLTGADSYATLENLEAVSADSRDAVKYSLYPAQLDGVARRILGADTVQDGNITRRVRASDVPRELLSRYMERRLSRDEEKALDRQQAAIQGKYSLARKPVDPKDPVFSAKNSKHDDAKIAGKRVAPRGMARRLSVLDLLYNNDLPERRGNNVGYVSRILNARAKRILGRKTGDKGILIEDDTSYDNLISDVFAAEALAALEETGNAANWYSEKVSEAVDTAAQLYPEIKTDLDARFAFLSALSVTSQNTPVMENAVYTKEVYDYYRANGRFPEYSKGKHGPSMRDNFIMLNDLLDRMGPQGVRELFESQFTVRELKQAGFQPPSGENVDTVVYGSFLLGPKIGQGFYQNLNGNFEPVTIDMWLMRSIGRVTGRLIGKPDIIQQQAERLIEGLNADPQKSRNNFLISSIRDAQIGDGVASDVDALVEIADELRREHDRIFKTPEVRALYERKEYNKPEWAKAAEAIVTQQNKPQDAPSGGNFRNAVRRIMNKTRKKLANSGYDVTNADLQAILWYPEKNLYKKLGVRTKENLNIDYAQAFEKILEGGIELDAEGNVLQTVGRGGRAEAVDVAGRVEEDGREISEADGAQVKYSLARPNETLLNFIKNNPEDGFTFDVNGKTVPSSGFAFAPIKGAEIRISSDQLNIAVVDELLDVVQLVQSITNENIYAGGWLDNASGDYFLDASVIIDDPAKALYYAEGARQEAIFDLGEFNEIRTDEGIEGLKASGLYSAEAHANARAAAEALGISFREKRPQDTRKFSLAGDGRRDRGGESRRTQALPGAPTNFSGPIQELVDAAEQYARQNGIDYTRQGEYVKVDEDFARRVAQAYAEMRHAPNDPVVREAYNNLARQTRAQYDALIDAGYTFTFFDSNSDPYQGNPWNAMRDLRDTKTMAVYGTYDGYGTEGITDSDLRDNPMLEDTGLRWKDQQGQDRLVTVNDLFRAVHDAFGHGLEGSGFRSQGEENAWQAHSRLYTGSALGAITSETRGQNSWLNYGPYGESNKNASLFDTVFAEQKTGLMPQFTWSENIAPNFEGETKKYSLARNVENQRRNLERYTKKIGAPVSAFSGRPLAARDETGYYPRIIITDPDGRNQAADVFVPGGYDRRIEDPAKPERSVGFGEKHYKKHQKKVPVHTYGSYNSIEDLARAALKAYWPFRNNPEAGGFKVKEQSGPTGNTRYRIEWQSEDFGYPAVFVFEPIYYDVLSPSFVRKNPEFSGRQTAQLVTAFIGPSDKVKNNPIAQPAISIDPDRTTERQKDVDRGVNDAINPSEARKVKREVLSLRNKFSLRRQDNGMTPDQKKLAKEKFNEEKNETFFEKIMGSMKMNDPRDRPFWLRMRTAFQDRYAGARYIAEKADEAQKMAVESHAWTAFSQLERSKGVSAAAITKGPLIRSGGLITALNEKLINNSSDPAAKRQYEEAFERLRRETRIDDYVDPTTGERVVLEYKDPKDLKGLAEIFAELDQNQMLGTFQLYAAGRRAQRLKQEGRENLFTDAEIETAIQAGVNNPAVERAYRQYQLWNKSLVNMMRDTGVISAEAAELWTQNADYLPFYRQAYDDAGTLYDVVDGDVDKAGDLDQVSNDPNNNIFENMYGVPAPKELKGGKPAFMVLVNNSATEKAYTTYENAKARADILRKMNKNAKVRVVKTSQRIESPLDNILRNLDAAVHASLSNVAASRAVRDLHRLGMARRLGRAPASPNADTVGIRINGEAVYYNVDDPYLLNAMKSSGEFSMGFFDILSTPARLLRTLITKEPGFMLANLMRDSMSSWMTSGVTRVPGPSTAVGLVKAIVGNAEAEALEAVGFVGGYDAKRDARAEAIFRQQRRSPLNPAKWWDTLDKLTMASDTATRVAVYNRVLKTTQNPTAAMFEALEVINFSRRGANTFFNGLTATIPFLNARIQGLDVMYRGYQGKVGTETTMTQQDRKRRFRNRFLSFVALNSMYAFWLMSEDEEENPWYYNANETDKDMYWIISPRWFGIDSDDASGFKIPIPFELGILGKVIPERIIRSLAGNTDQPDNWKSGWRHLTGTLAVQLPQAMMPLVENVTNHDFYSGRPIVPYWAGRTEAITADATTASPVAIAASNQLSDMNIDYDPRKIDHLIRGYLGTVGSYALLATDGVMRNYLELPAPADKRPDQYPVLSRFLQERAGTGPTEAFYTLANEVDVFTKTLANLDQQGRADDWYKRAKKNEGLLDVADDVKVISKELAELRKLRREIDNDRVMSAQDKKKSFIQIQEMMNEIASEYGKRKAEFMKRTD